MKIAIEVQRVIEDDNGEMKINYGSKDDEGR